MMIDDSNRNGCRKGKNAQFSGVGGNAGMRETEGWRVSMFRTVVLPTHHYKYQVLLPGTTASWCDWSMTLQGTTIPGHKDDDDDWARIPNRNRSTKIAVLSIKLVGFFGFKCTENMERWHWNDIHVTTLDQCLHGTSDPFQRYCNVSFFFGRLDHLLLTLVVITSSSSLPSQMIPNYVYITWKNQTLFFSVFYQTSCSVAYESLGLLVLLEFKKLLIW